MSGPIIEVQNLSKRYRLGRVGATTLREDLGRMIGKFRGCRETERDNDFWALRDLSFAIHPGEVAGILGRNGAGKSTLLKILSRITDPTSGRAVLRGRVASLLEVGTGFHPDLTGRENVFLNGAILGMKRAEIARRFDEIVAFGSVEKFIDTPVKHYSSGMRVRLAFAVAAHLDSEILIVDEVLAVGDSGFQQRCLGKMESIGKTGRTVLFVSHSVQFVSQLCTRAIVLRNGSIIHDGSTPDGIGLYLQEARPAATGETRTDVPHIESAALVTSDPDNLQVNGRPLEVLIQLRHPEPLDGAAVSFVIVNQHGQPATHLLIRDEETPLCREAGRTSLRCRMPVSRLYPGRYHVDVYFSERPGLRKFSPFKHACEFDVIAPSPRPFYWQPHVAAYTEDCQWEVGPRTE